jgi:hypothetical protein
MTTAEKLKSDPAELLKAIKKAKKEYLSTPEKRIELLKKAGIYDKHGKLAKAYK